MDLQIEESQASISCISWNLLEQDSAKCISQNLSCTDISSKLAHAMW